MTSRDETAKPERISDDALLELAQRQTFGYFWDFAHPKSGMARDRSSSRTGGSADLLAVGGTGFGVMAMIVAAERGWVSRAEARDRLLDLLGYLAAADQYHGVFPHYLDGPTGREVAFWAGNAGGDLVETAFLVQGLLCARQYFSKGNAKEKALCAGIDDLWRRVNWKWHTKGEDVLFWHRGPKPDQESEHKIDGWNECLIAYVLAASSPTYPVSATAYHEGWAKGRQFANGKALLWDCLASRPRLRRPAVLFALFLSRPRSEGAQRPLRRLLGAKSPPHARQLRTLRPEPASLRWLWPGLLGPYLKRRRPGLLRACPGSRSGRDHPDRSLVEHALYARGVDAGAAPLLLRSWLEDLGQVRFRRRLQRVDWLGRHGQTCYRSRPDHRHDRELSHGASLASFHELPRDSAKGCAFWGSRKVRSFHRRCRWDRTRRLQFGPKKSSGIVRRSWRRAFPRRRS